MEQEPQKESKKEEPVKIAGGEIIKWLAERPEAQQEILGGTFNEKEITGKLTAEVMLKTLEKMDLRLMTQDEVKAFLKDNPQFRPEPIDRTGIPHLYLDSKGRKWKVDDSLDW